MLIFFLEIKSDYYIFVLCVLLYKCCAKEESISLSIWDYYTLKENESTTVHAHQNGFI